MLPNILHTAFNLTIQKGDLPEEELLKVNVVRRAISHGLGVVCSTLALHFEKNMDFFFYRDNKNNSFQCQLSS